MESYSSFSGDDDDDGGCGGTMTRDRIIREEVDSDELFGCVCPTRMDVLRFGEIGGLWDKSLGPPLSL